MSLGALARFATVRVFDFFSPIRGPIDANGGFLLIKGFLSPTQVWVFLEKLGDRDRIRLTRQDVKFVREDPSVAQAVRRYLGPFSCLDHAMIWKAPERSTAGDWHHDSVGHRLKLFGVLRNSQSRTGTSVIPYTHRSSHRSYASERLSDIKLDCPPISLEAGDMMMFDTNAVHRGHYGDGERILLQLEFSDFFKGLLTPGKIGKFRRKKSFDE